MHPVARAEREEAPERGCEYCAQRYQDGHKYEAIDNGNHCQ